MKDLVLAANILANAHTLCGCHNSPVYIAKRRFFISLWCLISIDVPQCVFQGIYYVTMTTASLKPSPTAILSTLTATIFPLIFVSKNYFRAKKAQVQTHSHSTACRAAALTQQTCSFRCGLVVHVPPARGGWSDHVQGYGRQQAVGPGCTSLHAQQEQHCSTAAQSPRVAGKQVEQYEVPTAPPPWQQPQGTSSSRESGTQCLPGPRSSSGEWLRDCCLCCQANAGQAAPNRAHCQPAHIQQRPNGTQNNCMKCLNNFFVWLDRHPIVS